MASHIRSTLQSCYPMTYRHLCSFFTRAIPIFDDIIAPIDVELKTLVKDIFHLTVERFSTAAEKLSNTDIGTKEKDKCTEEKSDKRSSQESYALLNQAEAKKEEYYCCICWENPNSFQLASISGCSHKFCFKCIKRWSRRKKTCPLCNTDFSKICRVNKPLNHNRKRKRKGISTNANDSRKRLGAFENILV